MIARVVAWSARHHRAVIAAALLAAAAGELGRRTLRRDVIPDLSDPQIVLVADWMGHPAVEVARAVTEVLTRELDGVAGSTAVRGTSMSGMAYVDVVFASAAELRAGRRAILERVARARPHLPANARVQVGPEASSTGWVFQYALVDPSHGQPLLALRRLQDRVLRPALAAVPGVAEVASVGGTAPDVVVELRPAELQARGLAFSDVLSALQPVLAAAPATSLTALEAVPVPAPGQAPVRVGDVARVRMGDGMPIGIADLDGLLPVVGGIVIAERSADLARLVQEVRATLERERARLPPGVRLVTTYDRLDLVERVGHTLLVALAEEVAVLVLIILIFLLHPRSALVPLMTLPVVLLLTFAAMRVLGVPATIMSLGGIGIALGVAIDADVVSLEACHRGLEALGASAPPSRRRATLVAAAGSFAPAILTSLVITALTFLPVFAFTGETGRLLRPLALTKTLVVASAALVSLTLAPALRDRFLGGRVIPEFANPLTRGLVRAYRPFVHFALAHPLLTLVTAALAVASVLPIVPRLGGEFVPRVDEGDLLFMPTTLASASAHAHHVDGDLRRQDRAIAQFKEVATVFGKVGRADTATDLAPLSMVETTVRLLPRAEWPKRARPRWYSGWAPPALRRLLRLAWPEESPATMTELIASLDRATRLPGWSNAWTAPIRARIDMMSTGVRTPIGIRVVAGAPARLEALGTALRGLALRMPGTRSAVFESLGGETRLALEPDAAALARHHVDAGRAMAMANLVIAGGQIGELEHDGQRLRVRFGSGFGLRGLPDQLRAATIRSSEGGGGAAGAGGQPVPLGLLGRLKFVAEPAMARSERGELVAYVYVDLDEGTDLAGWVERARRELGDTLAGGGLALGPGERVEWTGQYQLLAAGRARLRWIVPAVALSMFLLLLLQFRSLAEALIVLVSVPFALVGSFWTLFLLGYPLSAPVWVGLLSVVGLAMQTGVVMVVYIDAALHRRIRDGRLETRDDIVAAHAEGTVRRLRPKIMTVTTMGAGLLPLLWAEGAGAEVMRRVAAPMIGGLATSAFLTLEVLPVIYTIWRQQQLRRAQRAGVPIAHIVGTAPAWVVDESVVPETVGETGVDGGAGRAP